MILAAVAFIAGFTPNIPPTVSVSTPKSVRAGSIVHVGVRLHFAEGLHGYQNPPSDEFQIPVTVKLTSGAKLVSIHYPKGTVMAMGGQAPVKVYSGDVTINMTVKAPAKSTSLVVSVNFQQCNSTSCFQPQTLTAKGTLNVSR